MIAAIALLAAFLQPQDEDERIRRCVRQLESDEPRQREEAEGELVRLGERVLLAIRASHQASRDAETRSRLDQVLRKIRQETLVTPERLRTTLIDLSIPEASLAGVALEVQRQTGIPIKLEMGEDCAVGPLDVRRTSVEALLRRICPNGYLWGIDRGDSVVVLPRDAYIARFAVSRWIDARDLLQPIPGAERVKLGLLSPSESGPTAGEPYTPAMRDTLLMRIREETSRWVWDNDSCLLEAEDGLLRFRNVPAVCDDVERAIGRLRETILAPVRIRVTAVAVRELAAEALRDGGDRLKEALAAGRDAVLLAEQEVAAFNDVPTFIYSGRETPYIGDYSSSGDLVRHLLREGLALSIRVTGSAEGKSFRMTGDFSLCRLEKMERFTTKHGDLHLPTVALSTFRIDGHPSLDQTDLVLSQGGCTAAGKEFSRVMVFVRVSRKP